MKGSFFVLCSSIIYSLFSLNIFALTHNDKNVKFLDNLQTLKTDFIQSQSINNKIEKANGSISVKKPDSIILDFNSKDIRLKLVSINGNVKMIDKDLNQTTYIDNQYADLMQFFTKNLKPEKLFYDKENRFCMNFQNQGIDWKSCLDIDLANNTLRKMEVFVIDKKVEKDGKITKREFKNMDIEFKNVEINKGVKKEEFIVKDSRIFDDEE